MQFFCLFCSKRYMIYILYIIVMYLESEGESGPTSKSSFPVLYKSHEEFTQKKPRSCWLVSNGKVCIPLLQKLFDFRVLIRRCRVVSIVGLIRPYI